MAYIPCKRVSKSASAREFMVFGAGTSSSPASADTMIDCASRNHAHIGTIKIRNGQCWVYGYDSSQGASGFTELFTLSASNTEATRSDLSFDLSDYDGLFLEIKSWDNNHVSLGFSDIVVS